MDETRRQATARRLKADYAEQIATLEAQSKLLLDRKTELEQSIATAPEIERQLAEFDRRLRNLQEQLDAVAQRRSEAEIGYRLEAERLSEQMLVLEPAVVPEKNRCRAAARRLPFSAPGPAWRLHWRLPSCWICGGPFCVRPRRWSANWASVRWFRFR
ncbi:hypothetical protein ACFOHS_00525 [Jhaorihella thermophila]